MFKTIFYSAVYTIGLLLFVRYHHVSVISFTQKGETLTRSAYQPLPAIPLASSSKPKQLDIYLYFVKRYLFFRCSDSLQESIHLTEDLIY